ncbi:right-handed parallel beta-helix repeat-containing protein [Candidatus Woesearchaeota archaeon]|nr:right-handed parallel beta-helix repeat-containing protein [Candidatus Woesearchaeota archaeon]
MYVSKKGEIGLVIVLLLVFASVGFIGYEYSQSNNSITGAVIGLQNNFSTQANCGITSCSCGDTVISSYTMTGDLTDCTGVGKIGLTIGADDITIDCAGYSIIGGLDSGGMGIRNLEYNNVIIQNCDIQSFETGIKTHVDAGFGNPTGGAIKNTVIASSPTGIYLDNNHTLIENVTMTFASTGIHLDEAFNITIANSTISRSDVLDIDIDGRAGNQLNHTLYGNDIEKTISLNGATINVLLYNNKFSSADLVIVDDGTNNWNTTHQNGTNIKNGPTIGGNYYATYTGVDTNDDGIGETPFTVGLYNDELPLVLPYEFLAPTTDLTFNSTFNDTNEMINGSNHSTSQNITFLNGTIPILTINATFTESASLSTSTVDYNDTAIVTDFSTATGIASTHTLYLNNSINDNGVVICPDATTLSQVTQTCSNSIEITKTNITEGVYVGGIFVATEGNRYRIENVSGTGSIINYNASLRIWDENDAGELHGGQSRTDNQTIIFYANFTDTGTSAITDATCSLTFHDGSTASMAYDTSDQLYNGNTSYGLNTTFTWNASCTSPRFLTLQTNDSVDISYGAPWCGKTLYLDTDLTQNLNGSGTCFIVARANIVINGSGYNISSNDNTGYGINTTGYENISIHSFNVIEGYQYGAYLESASNSSIRNSTIINRDVSNSEGIYLTASSYLNISNLTISTFGQQSDGIKTINSQENNYNNNHINTSGQFSDGISLSASNFSNLTNNVILTTGIDASGIYLLNNARNNTLTHNNVTSTNQQSDGIYLSSSSNNTLTNNNLSIEGTSGGAQGIVLISSSHENSLEFNTLTTTDIDGHGMNISNSNLNFFDNNIIFTTGSAASGLYFEGSSNTNLHTSNTFNTTGTTARALTLKDTSENNTFTNNSFLAAQIGAIDDLTGNSYNQTLNYSTSTGYISWISIGNLSSLMNISFNDTIILRNNTAAFNSSASASINNSVAEIGLAELDNTYNQIYRWENYNDSVNETYVVSQGSDCISTGTCSVQGFTNNLFIFTVDSFSAYSGVYEPAITCGLISISTTLNNHISTTGDCFTINANDLTLDCDGYSIKGDGGDTAIMSSGKNNVTIQNCVVGEFLTGISISNGLNVTIKDSIIENNSIGSTSGIYLSSTHNSTFSNLTVNNITTFGFVLANAKENIFTNITLTNTADDAIYMYGSYHNSFTNIQIDALDDSASDGSLNLYTDNHFNTFQDFSINDSSSTGYGVYIATSNNNVFINGTINGSNGGLWLSTADYNNISNLTIINSATQGIKLDGSAEENILVNIHVENTTSSIIDTSSLANTLIYNNSFAQITWNLTNLTTITNLTVGTTIFLENNNTGLVDDSNFLELTKTAVIELRDLDFSNTPHLARSGSICDTDDTCNISSYSGNNLIASVNMNGNLTAVFNTPPTIEFNFTNLDVYTNTSFIVINFTTTDAEGDRPSINISWYVNGISVKNISFAENPNGDSILANLSSTEYDYNKSDIINVSITALDNLANSSFSNTTTVLNTPPDLSTIKFNQSTFTSSQDMSVNTTVTDVDGDQTNVSLRWYINNTQQGPTQLNENQNNATTLNDSFLSPSQYAKFSLINVSFIADDGEDITTSWSSLINISNTGPQQHTNISDVSLTGIGSTTTINLSSYFSDEDGDSLTYEIDNISIANFTISSSILTITNNATGNAITYVNASDDTNTTIGNNFTITVSPVTTSSPSSGGSSSGSSSGGGGNTLVRESEFRSLPLNLKDDAIEFYTSEEAREFIKTTIKKNVEETYSLNGALLIENIGKKSLLGKKRIIDTPEDHNYLITRKTLGSKDSLFNCLSGIRYSQNAPFGNLLLAQLKENEEFIVKPGEKKEIPYNIKSPLFVTPRTLNVAIETFGEIVTQNGVEIKEFTPTGSAMDHIEKENALDLYLVVSPTNVQTGAVTGLIEGSSNFMYEVSINKKGLLEGLKLPSRFALGSLLLGKDSRKTKFTEMYGPYAVEKGDAFVLAQQLFYDPAIFKGEHIVSTTLYKDSKVVLQNDFEVKLGEGNKIYPSCK